MPQERSAPEPKAEPGTAAQAGAPEAYDNEFKFKVALEASDEAASISDIASKYGIPPELVSEWKTVLLEGVSEIFEHKTAKRQKLARLRHKNEALTRKLDEMKLEKEFLEKNLKKLGLL